MLIPLTKVCREALNFYMENTFSTILLHKKPNAHNSLQTTVAIFCTSAQGFLTYSLYIPIEFCNMTKFLTFFNNSSQKMWVFLMRMVIRQPADWAMATCELLSSDCCWRRPTMSCRLMDYAHVRSVIFLSPCCLFLNRR